MITIAYIPHRQRDIERLSSEYEKREVQNGERRKEREREGERVREIERERKKSKQTALSKLLMQESNGCSKNCMV